MRRAFASFGAMSYVLVVLNVGLMVVVGRMLWQGTGAPALLASTPAATSPLKALPVLARADSALSEIQDRPVFHATRRFFVPPDPNAGPPMPPRPDYQLVGTVIIPRKPTVALLKHDATSPTRKVRPGDDLDGWMVEAVEREHIELRFKDHQEQIFSARPTSARADVATFRVAPLVRNRPPQTSEGVKTLGRGEPGSATITPAALGAPGASPTASTASTASTLMGRTAARLYRPPPGMH